MEITLHEGPAFVVVTPQVIDRPDDLTGSPARRTKWYCVRSTDLERLWGFRHGIVVN